MAFTRSWDETDPANSDDYRLGAQEIRELKADIRERLNVEHVSSATEAAGADEESEVSAQTGNADLVVHREGSARGYYVANASLPTCTREGRIAFTSDTLTKDDPALLSDPEIGSMLHYHDGTNWIQILRHELLSTRRYATGTISTTDASATATFNTGIDATTGVWVGCGIKITEKDAVDRYYEIIAVNYTLEQITLDHVVPTGGGFTGLSFVVYCESHPQFMNRGGGTFTGPVTMNENLTMAVDKTVDAIELGTHDHDGTAGHGEQIVIDSIPDGLITAAKMAFSPAAYISANAYTGTVAGGTITLSPAVLWTPNWVIVLPKDLSANDCYWFTGMSTSYKFGSAGSLSNSVSATGVGEFTVGSNLNASGKGYGYICGTFST